MSRRAPPCTGLRALGVLLASVACLAGPPALAGWQSLGAFQPPAREGDALVFHGPQGTLSIAPAGEGVVRVRFVPGGVLPRDHGHSHPGQPGLQHLAHQFGDRNAPGLGRLLHHLARRSGDVPVASLHAPPPAPLPSMMQPRKV